jgi:hypothetical protein
LTCFDLDLSAQAYEKASPLSALAPKLQTMPPSFVPPGEVRGTASAAM